MSNNTDGYNDYVDYTYGYYHYWTQAGLKLASVQRGIQPVEIKNACELGFGQGVTLNLLASASDTNWYGTDFNSNHAKFADDLAKETNNNAKIFNMSFEEFKNVKELPKFDLIAIHGIYSWIDKKNQAILLEFISKFLSDNGMVYISYNTKPGTEAFRPAQHIIKKVTDQLTTHIEDTNLKIKATLNWMDKFHASSPAYLNAFATIEKRLKTLQDGNINYIHHEYMNDNWDSFYFSEIADRLVPCELKYLGQSVYSEDMDVLNYTNEQIEVFKNLPTPLKQDVQDSMTNTQFRRDIWMKNAKALTQEQREQFIKDEQVILLVPYELVNLEAKGKRLKIQLAENFYQAFVDSIKDYKPKSLQAIQQEHNFTDAQIIEVVTVLNSISMVSLVSRSSDIENNIEKSDKYNKFVLENATKEFNLKQLSSPVVAQGILMGSLVNALIIKAYTQGITTQKDQINYAVNYYIKNKLGLKVGDGVASTKKDLTVQMKKTAATFKKSWLPFLKAHRIL